MQLISMKRLIRTFLFTFVLFLLSAGVSVVEAAPRLYFDPATASKNVGNEFTVTAKIDSDGEVVAGADGLGTYDSTRLELVDAVQSPSVVFRDGCVVKLKSGGEFGFSCNSGYGVDDVAVSGDLVIFTFKAKATGTAKVDFSCTAGSTIDSNITKMSGSVVDIISCGSNGSGTYTIGEGSTSGSSDPAPAATNTPTLTPSSNSTSAELPQTGTVGVTVGLVVFGLVSLVSAVFLKFL